MAADPSIAAAPLSSSEEPRRWRRKLIIGLLGVFAIAALQSLLFIPGVIEANFCRNLFGIPFYLVYLPLCSVLVCLIALRLQLRFGLIWLLLAFVSSSYESAEKFEFLWSLALSPLTVYFREVIARFGDVVTAAACDIPYAPIQFWAAEAYGYGATSIGLLICIAYRFWPRRSN
jgi:hypothetical protein